VSLYDVDGLEIDRSLGLAGFKLAGRFTVLDLADLHRLLTLGPGVRWMTGTSRGQAMPMLRFRDRGPVMVARVILRATDLQVIGYRNGEPFDIRRTNLILTSETRRRPKCWPMPTLCDEPV
jgi:hypothetical protein